MAFKFPTGLEYRYAKLWRSIPQEIEEFLLGEIKRKRFKNEKGSKGGPSVFIDTKELIDKLSGELFVKVAKGAEAMGDKLDKRSANDLNASLKTEMVKSVKFPRATKASRTFIKQNIKLISTVTDKTLPKIEQAIKEGLKAGFDKKRLVDVIRKETKKSISYAEFVARDQMGKALAAIDKERQKSIGVKTYTWRTMKDGRVRGRHKKLEGTTHSWDKPPIISKDGRRGNPGDDYQCRCRAEPDIRGIFLGS